MPRRNQRYQPVQGVPYISTSDPGLTDYYSKILSDRTQRYDTAFQAQQQAQASIADLPSLDVAAKNQILSSFKERSQAIVEKHGGDYGSAARELSNLVATERENPFYAFNQRQLEQTKQLEQSLARNPNLHILKDPREARFEDFSGNLEDIGFDTVDPQEIRRTLAQTFDKRRTQKTELGITTKYTPEGEGYNILQTQLGLSDDEISKLVSSGELDETVLANLPQYEQYKDDPTFRRFLAQETGAYAQQLKGGVDERVLGLTAGAKRAREGVNIPTPIFGGTGNTQAINNPYIDQKNPTKDTPVENIDLSGTSSRFDENGNLIAKQQSDIGKIAGTTAGAIVGGIVNPFKTLLNKFTIDEQEYQTAKTQGLTEAKSLEEYQEELVDKSDIFDAQQQNEEDLQREKSYMNDLRTKNPAFVDMNDREVLNNYNTALKNKSVFDANKPLFSTVPGKADVQQIVTDKISNDLGSRKITVITSGDKSGFTGSKEDIYDKFDLSKEEQRKAEIIVTGLIPSLKSYSAVIKVPGKNDIDISVSADTKDQQYLDLLFQANDSELRGNTGKIPIWSEGRPYLLTTQILGGEFKSNLLPLDPEDYNYQIFQDGSIHQKLESENNNHNIDESSPFYDPRGLTLKRAEDLLLTFYK